MALLPLGRDTMVDALVSGRVDVLAANHTVTPTREQRVDFADPMLRDVRELVVTGQAAEYVATLDEHLVALNSALAGDGAPPIWIIVAVTLAVFGNDFLPIQLSSLFIDLADIHAE